MVSVHSAYRKVSSSVFTIVKGFPSISQSYKSSNGVSCFLPILIFFFFAFDVRLKTVHYEEWFPQYAGGQYQFENGQMIVSRGLARESTRVPRIFNRPELVIVDIKAK